MKKKMVRFFLNSIAVLLVLTGIVLLPSSSVEAATTSQNNIVARADYMYGSTWVCKKTVYGWKSKYVFNQGQTYHLPYAWPVSAGGYIGYAISVENFLKAAADGNSVFYTKRSHLNNACYSTYYGNDCSAFVSSCWGISRNTTATIGNWGTYIGVPNTSNNTWKLQLGDALNSNSVGHVVLVTGLSYNSSGAITQIEITEQTPPQLKRSYYTPAGLSSKYSGAYKIYRYGGNVPPAPNTPSVNNTPVALPTQKAEHLSDNFTAKITLPSADRVLSIYVENGNNVKLYTRSDSDAQKWKFEKQADGTYKITNVKYNQCLDVAGANSASGTNIALADDNGTKAQRWYIYYPGGDRYVLKPACSTNTVLSTAGGGTSTATNIQADTYCGNVTQKFAIEAILPTGKADLGNSFKAHITYDTAKKNISIYNENGYNVKLYNQTDHNAQKWQFDKQSDGTYKITNVNYNQCMDVAGAASANGTNIALAADNGTSAQRWTLIPVGNGRYIFRPSCAAATTAVMDVYGGNVEAGTNIQIYAYNGSRAQEFSINKIAEEIPTTVAETTTVQETTKAPITTEAVTTTKEIVTTTPVQETTKAPVTPEAETTTKMETGTTEVQETTTVPAMTEAETTTKVETETTEAQETTKEPATPEAETTTKIQTEVQETTTTTETETSTTVDSNVSEEATTKPQQESTEPVSSEDESNDDFTSNEDESNDDFTSNEDESNDDFTSNENESNDDFTSNEDESNDDVTTNEEADNNSDEEMTEEEVNNPSDSEADLKAAAKKLKISGFKQVTSMYGTTAVSMTWKKISDSDGYMIYRATTKNGNYKYLKTVTTNKFRDKGLKGGSKYYYKVCAYKIMNGKKVNGPFCMPKRMITKPDVPTNFKVKAGKKTAVITWTKSGSVNGYMIYVSNSKNGSYKPLKNVNSLRKSFTYKKLTSGKKYYFQIRAYRLDASGKKVYSGVSNTKTIIVK